MSHYEPVMITLRRPRRSPKRAVVKVHVAAVVNICCNVVAERDRVGAGSVCAVEDVGIQHLRSRGLPPTGGTAVHAPCPALAEATKEALHLGNKLVVDGVAVWTRGCTVDGVRIILRQRMQV